MSSEICWCAPHQDGTRKAAFLFHPFLPTPPSTSQPPSPARGRQDGPEQLDLSQSLMEALTRRLSVGEGTQSPMGEGEKRGGLLTDR